MDEILSHQRYPEDKTDIGLVKTGNELCNKGESTLNQRGTLYEKLDPHARNEKNQVCKCF